MTTSQPAPQPQSPWSAPRPALSPSAPAQPPAAALPAPTADATSRRLATIGARLGAEMLDGVFAALVVVISYFIMLQVDPSRGGNGYLFIAVPVTLFAYLAMYCWKVGANQSWGQRICGVRVVDKESGAPIGLARSVGRFFGRYLSAAFLSLGYLWALWDKDRQTWHDKIVDSVVISASPAAASESTAP